MTIQALEVRLPELLGDSLLEIYCQFAELTIVVSSADIVRICTLLRDSPETEFSQMVDLCAVDYLHYGQVTGEPDNSDKVDKERRYAVVYHLLSLRHNSRLRIKAYLPENDPRIESVISVWAGADWFEREAFDLFGIVFTNHPDLRRILTDYGFNGHPMRKDFPVSGHVEMRYDDAQGRIVYQPVSIPPRILVPKVNRQISRD